MGLKIGTYEFTKADIKPAIQTIFICVAIVLSFVIGRYAMAYEIKTILDYGATCQGELMDIDENTGTIHIKPPKKTLGNMSIEGPSIAGTTATLQ